MKVTLKELFNASYEACEVSLHVGNIEISGNKWVRFYVWMYDVQNDVDMHYELGTYLGLFNAIRFAPMLDEEQIQLLKQINKYERYWKLTVEKEYWSDEEMLAEWEKFKIGEYDEEDFGDDYTDDFAYQFNDGTFIKANVGEDGITCNIEELGEDPKMGTFTDLENFLYALAPIVQQHIEDNNELMFLASHIMISFNNQMEMEDIVDILTK